MENKIEKKGCCTCEKKVFPDALNPVSWEICSECHDKTVQISLVKPPEEKHTRIRVIHSTTGEVVHDLKVKSYKLMWGKEDPGFKKIILTDEVETHNPPTIEFHIKDFAYSIIPSNLLEDKDEKRKTE